VVLSMSMTALFAYASTIVNNLWPIIAISVGFSLGFAILSMVANAIQKAVRRT
jgi:hypothetical protein